MQWGDAKLNCVAEKMQKWINFNKRIYRRQSAIAYEHGQLVFIVKFHRANRIFISHPESCRKPFHTMHATRIGLAAACTERTHKINLRLRLLSIQCHLRDAHFHYYYSKWESHRMRGVCGVAFICFVSSLNGISRILQFNCVRHNFLLSTRASPEPMPSIERECKWDFRCGWHLKNRKIYVWTQNDKEFLSLYGWWSRISNFFFSHKILWFRTSLMILHSGRCDFRAQINWTHFVFTLNVSLLHVCQSIHSRRADMVGWPLKSRCESTIAYMQITPSSRCMTYPFASIEV